jgi:hypothetical protein
MFSSNFIFDNFWAFLILATVFNAFFLKARSQKIITKQPDLQEGYDQLFKAYLVYLNIPWVVMGIGIVFGGVPSFFSFFGLNEGNPFVLAFHVSIIVLWILSIWWLYFKGGAEFLAKYPGAFGPAIRSPTIIKIFSGLILAGGLMVMIIMWSS